ncbi:MAG: electron transfer flavoprotein subunit beta/FixA family protein [Micromonosporaceae bacterium]|nr:electron transfer flavoprotein subunit beta/FixA family protein [Micromonosporaceae bacterium]
MKVVVLVKCVPDSQLARSLVAPKWNMKRCDVSEIVSELDEYALEEALRLAETHSGSVTAVTVGPARAVKAVETALQRGAESGVHIMDDALAGSDVVATAVVLSAAVRRLCPDVVIAGMASTDSGTSLVPSMIAEMLGWPLLGCVDEVLTDGSVLRVRRERDHGLEVLEASMPVIVTVTDRASEPRFPSFRTILAAKRKTIHSWSLSDLGICSSEVGWDAARTSVESAVERPSRGAGHIEKDEGHGGIRLAEFLLERNLL